MLRELRSSGCSTSIKLNLADPRIVELCGLAGASAVWICNEHVGNDWFNLENQIRAAKLYDMDTIVRVEKGCYSDYIKPFEADATAIMVPHVSTAADAREIVQMTRFYPLGNRAMDGGNVDGQYCQIPLKDYIAHSNNERMLIFQIESPEALENVEEIAAVPGFDMLLFGPGDFSHLLGKPGEINHPAVVAARRRVAAAARRYEKFAMIPGLLAPKSVLEEEGYQCFNLCADVLGLAEYFQKKFAAFNEPPAKPLIDGARRAVVPARVITSSNEL